MGVRSPGPLLPQITVEDLRTLSRHHVSRNPRIVRVLVDLGYMRDQGEGIPRLFAEMEALFLPEPILESGAAEFALTLRNTPSLTAADKQLVASIGSEEVSDHEFRALLEAHRHGRIDNGRMRAITGLDTLGASQVLRRLRDRGWLTLHPAGAQSYYELVLPAGPGAGAGSDRGELGPDRGELGRAGQVLPPELREAIGALGRRPPKAKLQEVIRKLTEHRAYSPGELAEVLGLKDVGKLVARHLSPMVREGQLARTYPDNPAHPGQRYRARQAKLQIDDDQSGGEDGG